MLVLMLALSTEGCRTRPRYVQPRAANEITSRIVSGSRSREETSLAWEQARLKMTIEVGVDAHGPAFKGFQSATLTVKEKAASDGRNSAFLFGPSFTDWPDLYIAEATYRDLSDSAGSVCVTVTVGDSGHSLYRRVVYSATHPITWNESSTELSEH